MIYEADGKTLYYETPAIVGGSINIDATRNERRTLELTLEDVGDGKLAITPGHLWYDKVFKIYRGVRLLGRPDWYRQLGEFVIDRVERADFPNTIAVTGRDYTKKLLTSKFSRATSFVKGSDLETVIRAIAENAGIDKFDLPWNVGNPSPDLDKNFAFEREVDRWTAIQTLTDAYGMEVFFNPVGYLTVREFRDPSTSPPILTIKTGKVGGNLSKFRKAVGDSQLFNHIVVIGESQGVTVAFAEAKNENPNSPTNIDSIGDRTYQYISAFITSNAQAQKVADTYLKIYSLEEYEVNLEAIVYPWMEASEVIEFEDPNPAADTDPTRYYVHDLTIPLSLGAMTMNIRRVQIEG